MINVSPDHLPLDIECGPDSLVAVIRAVLECQDHVECQESPLKIQLVAPDGQASPSLFSVDDIPNGSIDPTATPLMNKLYREAEQHKTELWKATMVSVAENQPGTTPNVVTDSHVEQRRDWITDQINEWYGAHTVALPDAVLNRLILKVDDMIGSGIWAPVNLGYRIEVDRLRKELDAMRPTYNPESPVPISEASYQRARKLFATWQAEAVTHNISGQDNAINFFAAKLARVFDENQHQVNCLKDKVDTAERKIEEARIELNNLSNERAQPDPTEALANAYEEREHSDNAWAVGYMRKRIQELEAERGSLANALGSERERMGVLRAQHSNQHDELNKLFKMIEGWGWTAGNWDEWLQIYVDTLIKNGKESAERLNMRTGELQAALDLKNELIAENKKGNAERLVLQDENERLVSQIARKTHDLFSIADTNKKLENKVKTLERKLKKALGV